MSIEKLTVGIFQEGVDLGRRHELQRVLAIILDNAELALEVNEKGLAQTYLDLAEQLQGERSDPAPEAS